MMVQAGRRGRSGRALRTVRAREARAPFGPKAGVRWAAAIAALALLWCNGARAAEPHVILLRGWFGVFSTGLDKLAGELRAKGVNAEAAGHLSWKTAVSDIVRERAAGKTGPLVLVGHSQGANNVIDMARMLEQHNVPVDLLVTLAPFMQDPIPANVVRAVNYYQSPGWGAPIAGDRGFHGRISNIDVGDDWSITHVNIDKSARVQADIVREVVALSRAKDKAESAAASRDPSAGGTRPRSPEKRSAERMTHAEDPGAARQHDSGNSSSAR